MGDRFVTIAAFSQSIDAHVLKTRLEDEGIECFLADEHLVSINWLLSDAVGGVRLKVWKEDAERALEIIESESVVEGGGEGDDGATYYGSDVEDQDEARCPVCNSTDVGPDGLLAALNPFSNSYECRRCSHKWKRT